MRCPLLGAVLLHATGQCVVPSVEKLPPRPYPASLSQGARRGTYRVEWRCESPWGKSGSSGRFTPDGHPDGRKSDCLNRQLLGRCRQVPCRSDPCRQRHACTGNCTRYECKSLCASVNAFIAKTINSVATYTGGHYFYLHKTELNSAQIFSKSWDYQFDT